MADRADPRWETADIESMDDAPAYAPAFWDECENDVPLEVDVDG